VYQQYINDIESKNINTGHDPKASASLDGVHKWVREPFKSSIFRLRNIIPVYITVITQSYTCYDGICILV